MARPGWNPPRPCVRVPRPRHPGRRSCIEPALRAVNPATEGLSSAPGGDEVTLDRDLRGAVGGDELLENAVGFAAERVVLVVGEPFTNGSPGPAPCVVEGAGRESNLLSHVLHSGSRA